MYLLVESILEKFLVLRGGLHGCTGGVHVAVLGTVYPVYYLVDSLHRVVLGHFARRMFMYRGEHILGLLFLVDDLQLPLRVLDSLLLGLRRLPQIEVES